jgi:hypothetical protein
MIGGFLHLNDPLGRENAQDFMVPESILAQSGSCGSLRDVVVTFALRLRSGSLNRYPTLDGWSARPPGAPPAFFLFENRYLSDRRRTASLAVRASAALIFLPILPSCAQGRPLEKEGTQRCSSPNGSPAQLAPLHLQVVATRRLSRGSSARAQARPRLSCWMATRSPAQSSAARPTCFTAVSTHRAADAVARLIPRAPILSETDHRTLTWAGGFLLSEEPTPAGRCARGQEQEGT